MVRLLRTFVVVDLCNPGLLLSIVIIMIVREASSLPDSLQSLPLDLPCPISFSRLPEPNPVRYILELL